MEMDDNWLAENPTRRPQDIPTWDTRARRAQAQYAENTEAIVLYDTNAVMCNAEMYNANPVDYSVEEYPVCFRSIAREEDKKTRRQEDKKTRRQEDKKIRRPSPL
jgi:hypothetical protein